ncbi:MAG: class I SAM-dependent methyltransferase [Chloroflexi bacterium]|nr:class I SAM-dependent methyltransferase [Chloroflexota bacterium]
MSQEITWQTYDLIYREKDYHGEVQALLDVIQREGKAPALSLLDVACGTGSHLVFLRDHFDCTGTDLQPTMLEAARHKLPGLPFHQADMRDFDLGQTFDVVTCLFSAIGYMLTIEDLNRAIASMARHLAPGGLLLIEPWFGPAVLEEGKPHARFIHTPEIKIARMNVNVIEGHIYRTDFNYLIATAEGVRHVVEPLLLGMYDDATHQAAFEAAGLTARIERPGIDNRGLWIANRPT